MSANGTKQTSISTLNVSAFGKKTDVSDRLAVLANGAKRSSSYVIPGLPLADEPDRGVRYAKLLSQRVGL